MMRASRINNLTGLKAKVISPDDQAGVSEADLEQVGPGRYAGTFQAKSAARTW